MHAVQKRQLLNTLGLKAMARQCQAGILGCTRFICCDPQATGCGDGTPSDTALSLRSVWRSRTLTAVVSEALAVCAAMEVVVRIMLAPGTVKRRPPTVNRVLSSTSTTARKHLHGNMPAVDL